MKGFTAKLLIIFAVAIFVGGAELNSQMVNTEVKNDQSATMQYAKKLHQTNYEYIGDRNRMPAYPFIMSLFYQEGMSDSVFFELGKRVNIVIALGVLVVVFFVLRKYVSPFDSLTITLLTAFTVFVYKAPYFLAEPLFYGLNFGLFVLLMELIIVPRISIALAVGLVAGITHLTKASVLPALALGVACLILHIVSSVYSILKKRTQNNNVVHNKLPQTNLYRSLLSLFAVLVVFFTIIFPYIRTSKAVFGQYFYNVNSTFYIWYDSWEEAKLGTKAHGDRVGWPDMPEDQIPSIQKYLSDHTVGQILTRFAKGAAITVKNMCKSYGYMTFILLYCTFLSAFIWQYRSNILPVILNQRNRILIFFIACYFIGYFMLYAWYTPIAAGNRFILSLFLPMMFLLARLLSYAKTKNLSIQVFGQRIHSATINPIVLIVLIVYLVSIFPIRVITMYAGN